MGNHSVPRSVLAELGGLELAVDGRNSDQDLGLRLARAGVAIAMNRMARSVLLEHRRDLRSFGGQAGLPELAHRWPRPDVIRLREYFALGYDRSIAAYRGLLEAAEH